jgi:hypothetical protein
MQVALVQAVGGNFGAKSSPSFFIKPLLAREDADNYRFQSCANKGLINGDRQEVAEELVNFNFLGGNNKKEGELCSSRIIVATTPKR